MQIYPRNARTYPIILSIVAHVLTRRPGCEDTMRQFMILPHDGDGAQQLTSAAWLRSSRNLMTSTTPPLSLGAFVNHKRCVNMHRTHSTDQGCWFSMSLLSYTVALSGIQRQGSSCLFSGLLT